MPCNCFGKKDKKGGVGAEKYQPRDSNSGEREPLASAVTALPPATQAAPPPPQPPSPTSSGETRLRPEDDPDKASRRRDVVASFYSDQCELIGFKATGSRPPSSHVDGPAATSSPATSSPGSTRSGAACRADLAEKRREFFKELANEGEELSRNNGSRPSSRLTDPGPGSLPRPAAHHHHSLPHPPKTSIVKAAAAKYSLAIEASQTSVATPQREPQPTSATAGSGATESHKPAQVDLGKEEAAPASSHGAVKETTSTPTDTAPVICVTATSSEGEGSPEPAAAPVVMCVGTVDSLEDDVDGPGPELQLHLQQQYVQQVSVQSEDERLDEGSCILIREAFPIQPEPPSPHQAAPVQLNGQDDANSQPGTERGGPAVPAAHVTATEAAAEFIPNGINGEELDGPADRPPVLQFSVNSTFLTAVEEPDPQDSPTTSPSLNFRLGSATPASPSAESGPNIVTEPSCPPTEQQAAPAIDPPHTGAGGVIVLECIPKVPSPQPQEPTGRSPRLDDAALVTEEPVQHPPSAPPTTEPSPGTPPSPEHRPPTPPSTDTVPPTPPTPEPRPQTPPSTDTSPTPPTPPSTDIMLPPAPPTPEPLPPAPPTPPQYRPPSFSPPGSPEEESFVMLPEEDEPLPPAPPTPPIADPSSAPATQPTTPPASPEPQITAPANAPPAEEGYPVSPQAPINSEPQEQPPTPDPKESPQATSEPQPQPITTPDLIETPQTHLVEAPQVNPESHTQPVITVEPQELSVTQEKTPVTHSEPQTPPQTPISGVPTSPTNEDDGLGSEIDDALSTLGSLSEEGNDKGARVLASSS